MVRDDIANFVYALDEYLNNPYNRKKFIAILRNLIKSLEEDKEWGKGDDGAYEQFKIMIDLFSRGKSTPVVLILKNEKEKFDFYIFREGVSLKLDSIASSEVFMNNLRGTQGRGKIISDVDAEEALNFLKAYYLFRREPKLKKDAQNIVYDYAQDCLEMCSILEKYAGTEKDTILEIKSAILYDNEVLPYDLSYLDTYKKVKTSEKAFATILDEVVNDEYLGTSLSRVSRWW